MRIVSGGQTDVDQAALRAAACDIPTGGWAPPGWETEDGLATWLANSGLVECPEPGYPAHTRANVRDSDATLWLGDYHSPGGRTTLDTTRIIGRPFMIVLEKVTRPSQVVAWIREQKVATLNVADNRESTSPGIGEKAERFLVRAFRSATRSPSL